MGVFFFASLTSLTNLQVFIFHPFCNFADINWKSRLRTTCHSALWFIPVGLRTLQKAFWFSDTCPLLVSQFLEIIKNGMIFNRKYKTILIKVEYFLQQILIFVN